MGPTTLFLLQAVTSAPALEAASSFDLRKLPASKCGVSSGREIVVCGQTPQHRLKPLEISRYEPEPIRAEVQIGKAKGAVVVEQQALGAGTSNRAMIKLKVPF